MKATGVKLTKEDLEAVIFLRADKACRRYPEFYKPIQGVSNAHP